MKKFIAVLAAFFYLLALTGCGPKGEKYTIEIMIPAGSTEEYVYSEDIIRPTGKKIIISTGAGLGDTNVILKPVDETVETGYVATYLTQGMPTEFETVGVEDEWFRIGVSVQNDSDRGPIAVAVEVEGVEIREEEPTTPKGYPAGELQQPQVMYDGLIYFYCATGFDEPLPDGYECVGEVTEVDNVNIPQYDFQGARVELLQEIYVLPGIHDTIYIKFDDGYARFSLKQQTAPESIIIPTCRSIEEKIADDFIDPSTVSVLSGEWAHTVDPNRFVAVVSVNYINKFNEYETAEYVVLGTFEGEAHTRHCLNQHSPYTKENVLEAYGAIDNQRFILE